MRAQILNISLSLPSVGPVRVDRSGRGAILGAAIASRGAAKGHGFELDDVSLSQVEALGEGIQGRWTHPGPFSDGLGTFLGRWQNVRTQGSKTIGDFAFSAAAHQYHPPGLQVSAAQWLMDRAENDPDVLGVSIVAELELESVGEATALRKVARIQSLSAADFVSEPAANEALFSAGGQMAKQYDDEKEDELEDEAPETDEAPEAEEAPEADEAPEEEEAPEAEEELEDEEEEPEEEPEEALADKVKALEDRIAALEAELGKAEEELSEAAEANKSLSDQLEAYQLATVQAHQAQYTRYLELLASESASLGAPIPRKDLEVVRARFDSGDVEGGRLLGDAYIQRSRALSANAGSGSVRSLGVSSETIDRDREKAKASLLRGGGLKVELSDGKCKIISNRRTR